MHDAANNGTRRVSVIVTVCNMESCLRECLDSLIAQTLRDIEIICIDDGSTDSSLEILNRYAEKDDRVSVQSQNNAGPGLARNVGLQKASGEYIAIIDSDDVFDPSFLENMVHEAEKTDADIVVCHSSSFVLDKRNTVGLDWAVKESQLPASVPFSWSEIPDFIFTVFIGWPWDKLYRRSFVEKEELRFPNLRNSEDFYFVFLSLLKARRISVVNDTLVFHRVERACSVSNSRRDHPHDFYQGICMLKKAIRKDIGVYSLVSWGFLNWAFEYLVWNIESMPNGEARDVLLKSLLNDEFTEIEIRQHGWRFFSLFPGAYERYVALLEEACNIGRSQNVDQYPDVHPRLHYAVSFFEEAQRKGIRSALRKTMKYLNREKIGHNYENGIVKERSSELATIQSNVKTRCKYGREDRYK